MLAKNTNIDQRQDKKNFMKKIYEKRRGPTETFTEREKIIEHKKCGDRFFCNLAFLEEKKIIFSSLDDIITF